MHEGRAKGVKCSVLRLADYQPGTWLLSDRYSMLWLSFEDTTRLEALVMSMQDKPFLEEPPVLALVHDRHVCEPPILYAKPMTPGTYAFGGNWLWSDDPLFPADHPIPIHDARTPVEAEGY